MPTSNCVIHKHPKGEKVEVRYTSELSEVEFTIRKQVAGASTTSLDPLRRYALIPLHHHATVEA